MAFVMPTAKRNHVSCQCVDNGKKTSGEAPLRNVLLISLTALLPLACGGGDGGGETEADALFAGLLLGAQNGTAIVSGDAPVPLPPAQPAPPGQPLNEPILLAPQLHSADHLERDARVWLTNIAFEKPVHANTTLAAFIGRRNMTLLADNTVTNSIMHWNGVTGGIFTPVFFGRSFDFADQKIKILLVARNEFGMSTLEIPVRHARACQTALDTPFVLGDCGELCVQGNVLNPTTLQIKATQTTVAGNSYAYVDVFVYKLFGLDTLAFSFAENFDAVNGDPIPVANYDATVELDPTSLDLMCVELTSLALTDPPFMFYSEQTRIRVP